MPNPSRENATHYVFHIGGDDYIHIPKSGDESGNWKAIWEYVGLIERERLKFGMDLDILTIKHRMVTAERDAWREENYTAVQHLMAMTAERNSLLKKFEQGLADV